MKTALTVAALLLVAGCASRAVAPPTADATIDDTRDRCRSQTAVQRAADLDPPGQLGPSQQPVRLGRTQPADADHANCLRRYGITP